MSVSSHLTGSLLRDARERAHLTQGEAAARLNVSLRTYESWESETPPVPYPKHRRALLAFLAEIREAEVAA